MGANSRWRDFQKFCTISIEEGILLDPLKYMSIHFRGSHFFWLSNFPVFSSIFFFFHFSSIFCGQFAGTSFFFSLGHIFLFIGLRYTWENFKVQRSGKNWAWTKIIELFTNMISVEPMLIRMEVKSGPKHQLLHYDYHSNALLPKLLCTHEHQARHSFSSVSPTFPAILVLSFFFFFFFLKIKSAAGNVIQLIKKKISLTVASTHVKVCMFYSVCKLIKGNLFCMAVVLKTTLIKACQA